MTDPGCSLYVPGGQNVQEEAEMDALRGLYDPAGHSKHIRGSFETKNLYVPCGHITHDDEVGEGEEEEEGEGEGGVEGLVFVSEVIGVYIRVSLLGVD